MGLFQGRGAAANSAVCFVLCATRIGPVKSGLLLERVVSAKPRKEVIQWLYGHYGRDRVALCCTVMRVW